MEAETAPLLASDKNYTENFSLDAEGYRIGLLVCKTCGSVVLLGDKAFDSVAAHERWHMDHGERRVR